MSERSQMIKTLAQQFSVSPSTIYEHLKKGWTPDQPLKVRYRETRVQVGSDVNAVLKRWRP